MKLMEKSYYLTKEKMAVLLSSKKCGLLKCLDVFGENVDVDDNSACLSLFGLIKDGLVITDGERFELSPDTDCLISSLIDAHRALVIYTSNYKKSNSVIYKNKDSYVFTQSDMNRRGCLRVSQFNRNNIYQKIADEFDIDKAEITSDELNGSDISDDIYIMSLMFLNCDDDFANLFTSKRCRFMLDFIDMRNGSSYKKAAIVESDNGLLLGEWDKDTSCANIFSFDKLKNIVDKEFMEGY